jgi:hypothetical protein
MMTKATSSFTSFMCAAAVALLASSGAVAQNAAASSPARTPSAKSSIHLAATAGATDSADATDAPTAATPRRKATTSGEKSAYPYYIEFRSRSAQSYGHTFSIFGRLDSHGNILTKEVAGLHPATESPIPWMIGHLVLVPSETGASDGDLEDQYVTARFRVDLTEAEYVKLVAYIREHQAHSPVWHAVLYNCNAWVGDVARFMGMEAPLATLQYPEDYIDELRDMNINRHSPDMIGTPTKVASANALRAIALHQKRPPKTAKAAETESVAIQNKSESTMNAAW